MRAFILQLQLSDLENSLLQELERWCDSLNQAGFSCRAFTPDSLRKLQSLSEERQRQILQHVRTALILQNCDAQSSEISPENPGEHPEKSTILRALEFFSLELRDESFWKQVGPEDLIEIYNIEQVQIFRTFNFFKLSSYSLLDLLVNEWFLLWERPTFVFEKLLKVAQDCLQGVHSGSKKIEVPAHLLKEIYRPNDESAMHLRSILNELGFICPVYRQGLPGIGGFVVSSSNRVVAIGPESRSLSFL